MTTIDKKTKGSWLVYQTGKLQHITNQTRFENTYLAGKAGILLSAISNDSQSVIESERLNALARASQINKLELPSLIGALQNRGLVDQGSSGIEVLGVTTASCLEHTADLFEDLSPTSSEQAAIELCEQASTQPLSIKEACEEISDSFLLSTKDSNSLVLESCDIGFVDTENIDKSNQLIFNGNLFRRDDVKKISKVLESLSQEESRKLQEFSNYLTEHACVALDQAEYMLSKKLFIKITSVGIFDVSIVSNDQEKVAYVTRPAAFSKYSNSMVDDAFDLAKMFVSSLTYGMSRSHHARGQIRMIEFLMNRLIQGFPVGPVAAIGQDYRILELRGVVQVYEGTNKGRKGPLMKLLKKDVGVLALEVIKNADASQHSLDILPGAAVNKFKGPEENRVVMRRREVKQNPQATREILLSLRTGGKF